MTRRWEPTINRSVCSAAVMPAWWLCVAVASVINPAQVVGQHMPPALVRVGLVQVESLQARREVVGRLQEVRRVVVAAEQPGRIVQMTVNEGDVVVKNETVLAQIDEIWARNAMDLAQARLEQAKAGVAESFAQFEQAVRDRSYLDELLATKSAKPKEVADAHTTQDRQRASLNRAEADVMEAQADLNLIHEQISRLTVLAPFDGLVIQKMTEVGDWVDQGDPVAEMISHGLIDAMVDVPESVINLIEMDGEVEIFVEPLSLELAGRVVVINPWGGALARTFPVKIRLDDRGGELKPGMSVLARIPISQIAKVLTVPRDAVCRLASGGKVVWVNLGSVAVPVAVEVLFGHGDRYAIRPIDAHDGAGGSRLVDQTQVVVEGAERLSPNRPLKITKQAGSDLPAAR